MQLDGTPYSQPEDLLIDSHSLIVPLKLIVVSPLQSENAYAPIEVTLLGIVILVSPLQQLNAESPIDVTLSGMVILVSPLQL